MPRAQSHRISDPVAYFLGWYYKIEAHHFETMGVTLREFVKNKVPYTSYTIQEPPTFQFLQGYIFYTASDSSRFLQIAAEVDPFRVEVHIGKTGATEMATVAYTVSVADCATWLRTGEVPAAHKVIDVASSKAGLLAWQLQGKAPYFLDS